MNIKAHTTNKRFLAATASFRVCGLLSLLTLILLR